VEDHIDAAAVLKDVLELWDYDVEIAHSGEDALASVSLAPPDVIVLDIGLTGMNGYEVAMRLRSKPELDGTLLVALTGYGREADRARCFETGFDLHFTKPVDPDKLRAAIVRGRMTDERDKG
ncbi:MAG TPA: response regulator, partial [Armatimonadota bacterium]|nr:response regulator [Armatimonadota bacterium]